MATFSEFITKCETRADYNSTRTTLYLQETTVRKLKEVSVIRSSFMEGQFTFSTTADDEDYGSGYAGFPTDLMEIDALYGVVGTAPNETRYLIEGPVTLEEVRNFRRAYYTQPIPEFWAWHNNLLILSPRPSAVQVITGDYLKDATKDSATGDTITTGSTTHTNGWFDRGEQVLMNLVLYEYHLAISHDGELAAMAKTLAQEGLDTIRKEVYLKQYKGGQPRSYWTDGAPYGWF